MNDKKLSIIFVIFISIMLMFFTLIIIINAILILKTADNSHIASIFGMKAVIYLSDIQSPEMENGELILFGNVDKNEIKNGSIICYLQNGRARICRVASIEERDNVTYYKVDGLDDLWYIKGKEITIDEIEGIYTGKGIKGIGKLITFMQTRIGMLTFVFLPLIFTTIEGILYYNMMSKEDREKMDTLQKELSILREMSGNEKH